MQHNTSDRNVTAEPVRVHASGIQWQQRQRDGYSRFRCTHHVPGRCHRRDCSWYIQRHEGQISRVSYLREQSELTKPKHRSTFWGFACHATYSPLLVIRVGAMQECVLYCCLDLPRTRSKARASGLRVLASTLRSRSLAWRHCSYRIS